MSRLFAVALLGMLLGQWTVLAHSIAHARASGAVAVSTDTDHAWGHYAGTSECRLIDHLIAGQAPGDTATTVVPDLPPAALQVAMPAESIGPAAEARGYEARGPPRA